MRELEAQIAEREEQLEALKATMATFEVDVQRSAEEKALLRAEYEAKVAAVAAQMVGLRKRLKEQVRVGEMVCMGARGTKGSWSISR